MPRTRRVRANARDVQTLAAVGEYGVLDRELCHLLCYAHYSTEWCRQNLARLTQSGLLRATALQVWHDDEDTRGGRIPLLYSLSPTGAEIVQLRTGIAPRRILRSDPAAATFWHRLQVVRVRVAFDQAAARVALPAPCWIMEEDLCPHRPHDRMPNTRRILYHEFRTETGKSFTCQPDSAAVMTIPHPSGIEAQASSLAIYFEIDRSREGIAQCLKKIAGYSCLFERRDFPYWAHLRNPVFRVLWVVPSDERIEHLIAAFSSSPIAQLFRFATFDDCRPDRILTQPIWFNMQGDPMTLYRQDA